MSQSESHTLEARLEAAHARMAAAARRAGRDPARAQLIVVTKSVAPAIFPELSRLGVTDLGENRVQDAARRLAGHENAFRWHFIGHLQSNKVRKAVPLFDVFHGVDSAELLLRIDRVAGELGRTPDVFLQVNVSGEASKSGLAPEQLGAALGQAPELAHARLVGLMTMAPWGSTAEEARPIFRALARLRARHADVPGLEQLSMGMSADFEVAIEEGATWVRIGRSIAAPQNMT